MGAHHLTAGSAVIYRGLFLLAASWGFGATTSAAMDFQQISSVCLETQLQNCRVEAAGFINGSRGKDGVPRIAWQAQTGVTAEEGVMGGFVLFTESKQGGRLLAAHFDGWFSPPVLNNVGMLHVPGFKSGTAAWNADRLYQWRSLDGDWQEIAMDKWRDEIGKMLPDRW